MSCRLDGDTVWLSQRQFAELYQIGVGTVNHHIKAIFAEDELSPEATLRRYRIVQDLGSRRITREVDHISLAMGLRVRNARGTQSRQWAFERLGKNLTKGFALNDARGAGEAESPQHQRQPKDRRPPRASEGLALIGGAQSFPPLRLSALAPHPPRRAPHEIRAPASQPPNFFRHPLLHPLTA